MKKVSIFCVLMMIAVLLCLSASVLATENTVTLSLVPGAEQIEPGSTLDVQLSVTENPGILQAQLQVSYPVDALQLLSVSTEGTVFDAASIAVNTETAGTVILDLTQLPVEEGAESAAHTATGLLVTLHFQTVENYRGQVELSATVQQDSLQGADSEAVLTVNNATAAVTVDHVHKEVIVPGEEASCTKPGLTEGSYCEICGETVRNQDVIEAPGHKEVEDPAQDATCTADGKTAGSHCETCGETIIPQQVIESPGHQGKEPVREKEVFASCVSDGSYDSVVYCSVCETEMNRENRIVVANGEHVYATEQERVEASCTVDGYVLMACGCGETKQTVLTAPGHTEVEDKGYDATCTEPGLTDGSHCEICSTVIQPQQTIEAKNHKEKVLTGYAATCTEPGLTDGTVCEVCNDILVPQQQTALAPHSEEIVPGYAPTCTEPGKTDGVICAICNAEIQAQQLVNALDHTPVEVEEKIPTCAEDGHTAGTKCQVCQEVLSGCTKVDSLPHTEVVLPEQYPTCSAAGMTEGRYCSVCGEVTLKQLIVAPVDHSPEVIEAIAPTCTAVGWTEGSRCSMCNEVLEQPMQTDKLAHVLETVAGHPATCIETGLTDGTHCLLCGETVQQQTEIPRLEHSYSYGCDPDCDLCGSGRASLTHSYGAWRTVRNATEDAVGEEVRQCDNCEHTQTRQIPKLTAVKDGSKNALIWAYVIMAGSAACIAITLRKRRSA